MKWSPQATLRHPTMVRVESRTQLLKLHFSRWLPAPTWPQRPSVLMEAVTQRSGTLHTCKTAGLLSSRIKTGMHESVQVLLLGRLRRKVPPSQMAPAIEYHG